MALLFFYFLASVLSVIYSLFFPLDVSGRQRTVIVAIPGHLLFF